MKELGRAGLIVIATVFLVCAVTSERLHAQKDQEPATTIVGAWTLDKKLSDVAEDRPHEGGGQHSRGGGGFPGGGGHGRGGFHGGGGGALAVTLPIPMQPLVGRRRGEISSRRRIT